LRGGISERGGGGGRLQVDVGPEAHVLAAQEHVDLAERRAPAVVRLPALDEQVVHLGRAGARAGRARRRRAAPRMRAVRNHLLVA